MLSSAPLLTTLAAVDLGDYLYFIIIALAALSEIARRIVEAIRGKPQQPPAESAPPSEDPKPARRKPAPVQHRGQPEQPTILRELPRDTPVIVEVPRPAPARPAPTPFPTSPQARRPDLAPPPARRAEPAPAPRRRRRAEPASAPVVPETAHEPVEAELVEGADSPLLASLPPRGRRAAHSRLARALRSRQGALEAIQFAEILAPPVSLRENHLS